MSAGVLERLSALCGIAAEYHDIWGKRRQVSVETRRALLAAMGVEADTDARARQALQELELRAWRRVLPPVAVARRSGQPIQIVLTLPAGTLQRRFEWVLTLENGARLQGQLIPAQLAVAAERRFGNASFVRCAFTLPDVPATGYHRFELRTQGGKHLHAAGMSLIVAPSRCFQGTARDEPARVWGLGLQLYAQRSRRNWGMGDFTDLRTVVEIAAEAGAGIVGVNPLHALFPHRPAHASPYSPSSRLYLNALYIDVETVADFAACDAARLRVAEPDFQARLAALRAADLVDYPAVAAAKIGVLELLYQCFRGQTLPRHDARAQAFRQFQANCGASLRRQALFDALQEHFHAKDESVWGWPVWPESYRDPSAPVVAEFAAQHMERVEFFEYLQWQAELQLAAAARHARERGLEVGLYRDLAVGVDRGGGEAWADQELYALDASIGAPPDLFNMQGQNWGLPPLLPQRLTEAEYEPFIATLRANMRHAGALRIDHVMGLMRLYWIPAGGNAAEGAYVAYPGDDLFAIVALESQRNRCIVIGEDLGTVPESVRARMAAIGMLSYRLFYFEKDQDGRFLPPAAYPREALVALSTHDLPTLAAYWQGSDLDTRTELRLFPSDEQREQQIVERAQDRARLLFALEGEGLLPEGATVHPVGHPALSQTLARALQVYLARTPAQIMMVQPEDFLDQLEPVNLPSSGEAYPNWRRKLPLAIEEWPADARFPALAEALRKERGHAAPEGERATRESFGAPLRVPLATYRLQFNASFTFAQATEAVPYLHELGISHCYASPYLKARPGSVHGYDIIDHNALNPEIGNAAEFEAFVAALQNRGMGQIVDVVPNHMGVLGSDNSWWLDVLESGPASAYAGYFDIDWQPLNSELRGKVLLPVLGDHYGTVLDKGELRLAFDAARGELSINYYHHRFPVDPREYPRVLGRGMDQLAARLGSDHAKLSEYQSLVTAFGHLPPRDATAAAQVAERKRDNEIHKRHLAELCSGTPELAALVAQNVADINGTPGDPASLDALHQLINAQAFRLAYWRVASDDINYRRFFDINDLAALRMEDDAVFDATHQLVLELVARGQVDGLRIDHPDGLSDPARYFARLQERCAAVGPAPGSTGAADAAESAGRSRYLVVEKILAEFERLPEDWQIHGTTGYRYANVVNGVFVDTEAASRMERIYAAFIGETIDFDDLVYRCKRVIMRGSLASELSVLANRLSRIAQASRHTCDFTLNGLRDALLEIVACFPVYRTYITAQRVTPEDKRYIDWAVAVAKKKSHAADVSIFDFLREVLSTAIAESRPPELREMVVQFVQRLQQFTAPVMAKGVEDTAFYIYNRLVSLNEVGGHPRTFGLSVAAFHAASQDRAAHWPYTMLATSTHDSKRSEDVRARINVLSEIPAPWKLSLRRWSRINRSKKRQVDGRPAPSRNDEYLLYQTLLGTAPLQPLDEERLAAWRERIEQYIVKAAREAKVDTSWINPNAEYEAALAGFVAGMLGSLQRNRFLEDFVPAASHVARCGMLNSLAQTLLKMTSPGVPDCYQGNELWQFSLVDPDNRRPVDFAQRRTLLHELKQMFDVPQAQMAARVRELVQSMNDGRIKLYLTWRALQLRQQHEALFLRGGYEPLLAEGVRARHVLAFARRGEGGGVITVVARFASALISEGRLLPLGEDVWGDTTLPISWLRANAKVRDVLTGKALVLGGEDSGSRLALAAAFAELPVALLEYQLPD